MSANWMMLACTPAMKTGQLKPRPRGLLWAVAERGHEPVRALETGKSAIGGR